MNPVLNKMNKSSIRIFHDKIRQIDDVVDFTLGDSKDNVHEEVKNKTIESIENNETHYSESQGLVELRKELSLKEVYYEKNEICITSGATQGLFEVMFCLFDKNDGILVAAPMYPAYTSLMTLLKLKMQNYSFDDEFQINEENLRKQIKNDTKAILINHPHNPTGTVLNQKSIEILHKIIIEYDLILIWDAVYYECGYYPSLYHPLIHKNIIQIHSFSKSSLMCGFRVGYVCASEDIIKAILKVHQLIQSSLPVFTQKGALEALNHEEYRYDEQKKYIFKRLKNMGIQVIENEGPYYIFFSIIKFNINSEEFADTLLNEYHVAVLPGKYFMAEYHIRMSCCIDLEECKKGCDRMEAFVKKL